MFIVDQTQTYWWPVKFELPVSGGNFAPHTFDAEFKRISQSRLKDLIKGENVYDADICREVMVGWRAVVDAENKEVPFSESARDQLIDIPLVAAGVVQAFMDSITNAKRKN